MSESQVEPKILYEDGEVLVIDKPAGMVVNRAQSVKGETVEDWIEKIKDQKLKIKNTRFAARRANQNSKIEDSDFYRRSGVVHRIDKETSGVLVIAKTPEAFSELQRQFKDREVEKKYIALVHGKVFPTEGEIKTQVGRLPWNRERFGVLPGGREAETAYSVLRSAISGPGGKDETYSLLELRPKTGRTHQIRVHLKSIGHPIVGDEFYAGRKTARADRKWCPRLFLHASYISFTHPASPNGRQGGPKNAERVAIKSRLPRDLTEALENLNQL